MPGPEPSKAFEYTEQGFVTYTYDNAAGEYSRISYVWEETRGEYVKGEAVQVPEGTKIP